MPDFADHAAEAEHIYCMAALSKHADRSDQHGPSACVCEDCDQPIPESRRAAVPGCTRCVACQTKAERSVLWK